MFSKLYPSPPFIFFMGMINIRLARRIPGRQPEPFGTGSLRFYPQMFEEGIQGSAYKEYWIS